MHPSPKSVVIIGRTPQGLHKPQHHSFRPAPRPITSRKHGLQGRQIKLSWIYPRLINRAALGRWDAMGPEILLCWPPPSQWP